MRKDEEVPKHPIDSRQSVNQDRSHGINPTQLKPHQSGLQSQPFFRRYGFNLPTSLAYLSLAPEAFDLGDLMRFLVRHVERRNHTGVFINQGGCSHACETLAHCLPRLRLYGQPNSKEYSSQIAKKTQRCTAPGSSCRIRYRTPPTCRGKTSPYPFGFRQRVVS